MINNNNIISKKLFFRFFRFFCLFSHGTVHFSSLFLETRIQGEGNELFTTIIFEKFLKIHFFCWIKSQQWNIFAQKNRSFGTSKSNTLLNLEFIDIVFVEDNKKKTEKGFSRKILRLVQKTFFRKNYFLPLKSTIISPLPLALCSLYFCFISYIISYKYSTIRLL